MATFAAAPPSAPSNRQTQRLQKDLNELQNNPLPFIRDLQLSVVENLNRLTGILIGPDGSDYAGGHFHFVIQFPLEYPFKPADFIFITSICHPNVDSKTGTACHDQLLASWAPSITLRTVLTEMHSLLAKPNYDTPIEGDSVDGKNPEAARLLTQKSVQQ